MRAWEEARILADYASEVGLREDLRVELTLHASGLVIRAELPVGRIVERTGVILPFEALDGNPDRARLALDEIVAELQAKVARSVRPR
jgi:hypothetical protein